MKEFKPKNMVCKKCRKRIAIANWRSVMEKTEKESDIFDDIYCIDCAKELGYI